MSLPKIIERTLYPPLTNYLQKTGFEATGEASTGDGTYSDLLIKIKNESFVVEVKIGKPSTTLSLKAMAQAGMYARKYGTTNFMVLIFSEEYKNKPITSDEMLDRLVLHEKATCLIFSDYWTESLQETPANIFLKLKHLIETDKHTIDFKTVVEQIKTFVLDLNSIIYQVGTDELVLEVVKKLDLFTAIGDVKNKEMAKRQIINLSSYLLFNQLLFYYVYQKRTKNNLSELNDIKSIKDIQTYFDAIRRIDYKAIYQVDILRHIPDKKDVVDVLNDVLGAMRLLRAEYITHDLAGRFFHDLIPFEVRKVLAAFYTHPSSADLLTGLTIDSWDETIIDISCGSGTLLVSSYQTKRRLYLDSNHAENLKRIHRQFLEHDITAIDIMPFASHITAINLAMQDIEQPTNLVRIASTDSLDLAKNLKLKSFTMGKGLKISSFETTIQQTLTGDHIVKKIGGSVSVQGVGKDFYLKPNDIVIMNPPFSDRERMPKEMRDKINNNEVLNKVCGSQVNLWGLFIALSDLFLKGNGKVGAVIPINIARGEATQEIRSFILRKYTAKFIIKPLADDAFSEGASFKDILYIAQKKKPSNYDYTGIVSIKISIKSLNQEQVLDIVSQLKQCYASQKDTETKEFEIKFIKTQDLLKYENNLMPLIGFTSHKNKELLSSFLEFVHKKAGTKIMKIPSEIVAEGFHASPSGLSELVFITRPIDSSRVERAFMVLKKEEKDLIEAQINDTPVVLSFPLSKLQDALRTLTGVKSFNVEGIDYILTQKPEQFNQVLQLSKWKGDFNWFEHGKNVEKKLSFVVVGRRFRPNSKNTHHFAFYSKDKILAPHTFKILKFSDAEDSLIQTLILNSSITMSNILSFREQTTGGFTDIMESELVSFDIFNLKNLNTEQKVRLENLFSFLKNKEFPSILEQYTSNNKERRLLDATILEILGIEKSKIDKILDELYVAIAEELQAKG